MNCYNGERFLKKTILSVLDQKYQNWELIFWDNQSKDGSKKILNLFKKDKRIKYYYAKSFSKLYKARNLAVQKCKGKFRKPRQSMCRRGRPLGPSCLPSRTR